MYAAVAGFCLVLASVLAVVTLGLATPPRDSSAVPVSEPSAPRGDAPQPVERPPNPPGTDTEPPEDSRTGQAEPDGDADGPPREEADGPPLEAAAPQPLQGHVIALDPGHNGRNAQHRREITRQVDAGGFHKDCNTTGASTDDGYPESAFTWALASQLAPMLERLGARVVLTRPDDAGWGPCVDERAAVANRAGADLLLSLHADGAPSDGRGFHVIAPGEVPGYSDDIVVASADLARAVRDALVATAGLEPSTYLGRDGIDVRTDLGTLNHSDVPAVIVECGNLRNTADAALLTSEEGRRRIAAALGAAVVDFLDGR